MLKTYSKILDILEKIAKVFLAITAAAMVLVLFYQVVMRYIFNNAAAWPEELARYLFIYDVMVAAAIAVRRNSHLQIDALIGKMSPKTRAIFTIISTVLGGAFLVYLLIYSITLVSTGTKTMTTALPFSMAVPYRCIPVGVIMMLLASVEVIFKNIDIIRGKGEEDAA